jgi:hypothetical protein
MVLNADDGIPNLVTDIIEDRINGGYWFGMIRTEYGSQPLLHFKDGEIRIYNYEDGLNNPWEGSLHDILTMAYDSANNFWCANKGLYKYKPDEDNFVGFLPPGYGDDNRNLGWIMHMMNDPFDPDIFWLCTRDGIGRFDTRNKTWLYYGPEDYGLEDNRVNWVTKDREGNLWFAVQYYSWIDGEGNYRELNGGVTKFDGSNFTSYSTPEYFEYPADFAYMAMDYDGCIWAASGLRNRDSRVYRFFNGDWVEYTADDGLPGLPAKHSYGFLLDRFGKFWCSTTDKTGSLVQFKDGKWHPVLPEIHELGMHFPRCIYQDSQNNFWFGGHPEIAIRWGSD